VNEKRRRGGGQESQFGEDVSCEDTHTSISCVGLLDERQRTIEDGWFPATERESGTERWEEVIGGLLDCVWLITSGSDTHTRLCRGGICHTFTRW